MISGKLIFAFLLYFERNNVTQISNLLFQTKRGQNTTRTIRALQDLAAVWPEHHGPKTPRQGPKTPTQNTTQKPKKTPLFG